MRQRLVIANWKMNGQINQAIQLTTQIKEGMQDNQQSQVVLMPPTIYIPLVHDLLQGSRISLGAQNVYPKDAGAYTGELSAPMLKEFGCKYVLVGHSERRQFFNEDENFVAEKFHHVKNHGMIPVLCVGETLDEHRKGQTEQVITKQVLAVTKESKACFNGCVIAYEPVWAIGTGQTAEPEQAQAVHQFVRSLVSDIDPCYAEQLPLLYGGSVNEKNAKALFSMPDVDGGLVGGASLNAKQFLEIVTCIN